MLVVGTLQLASWFNYVGLVAASCSGVSLRKMEVCIGLRRRTPVRFGFSAQFWLLIWFKCRSICL